jgi:hypothetical protein
MMKFVNIALAAIFLLLPGYVAYAIPIDLSSEESERLKVGLEKCVQGVEKQFGVKFVSFANYDVRAQKDAFTIFADIVATISSSPAPSPKPDENTRYFQCKATLKAGEWQLESKPFIIKTREKGTFKPPSLDGYRLEARTDLEMDNEAGDETKGEQWVNEKGQIILKFITKGRTWAWGVLGNPSGRGEETDNYSLVDSDGDGVLDEKYPIYVKFPLPDWLKDKEKK